MRLFVSTSLIYAITFPFWACSNVSGEKKSSDTDSLAFSYKVASYVQKDSKETDTNLLFQSTIIYPDIEFKKHSALRDSVESYIVYSVFRGYKSAEEATKAFVEESLEQTKGLEGFSMKGWQLYDSISVKTNSSKIFTIKVNHYSYTGGAHGEPSITYANFKRENGKRLTLTDIIEPNKFNALKELNVETLREIRKVEKGKTLEDAGLFISGNDLSLPSSFAITSQGLLLSYNYYEITAYAEGVVSYTIPFDKLKGILKEEYSLR